MNPCVVTNFLYTSCIITESTNTVMVKLNQASIAGDQVEMYISDIRNPKDITKTGSITVSLCDTSALSMNTGTYIYDGYELKYSYIDLFTVTPGSYVAGAVDVEYTFTFMPMHVIVEDS